MWVCVTSGTWVLLIQFLLFQLLPLLESCCLRSCFSCVHLVLVKGYCLHPFPTSQVWEGLDLSAHPARHPPRNVSWSFFHNFTEMKLWKTSSQ